MIEQDFNIFSTFDKGKPTNEIWIFTKSTSKAEILNIFLIMVSI